MRNRSSSVYILFTLLLLALYISAGERIDKQIESEVIREIDSLYEELQHVEESIGKSLRKLQVLKKIQAHRVEPHTTEDSKQEITDELELEEENEEEVVVKSSFLEKNVVDVNSTQLLKFKYLDTPLFLDKEESIASKVLVAFHTDATLGIYSLSSGSQLSNFEFEGVSHNQTWQENTLELITDTYGGTHMMVSIWNTLGDVFIVDLEILKEKLPKDKKKKMTHPKQYFSIKGIHSFNTWDETVKSNSTLFGEEIQNFKKDGLAVSHITFFANDMEAAYVMIDNKGFITLIRRDSRFNPHKGVPNNHDIFFYRREISGFEKVDYVKQQAYLTLIVNEDKIRFMRVVDAKIAPSVWSINSTNIKNIVFDESVSGRFYASTENGEIHVLQAKTRKPDDVYWDQIGIIKNNPKDSFNLVSIRNILLSYEDISGTFQVFNMTKARIKDNKMDYSDVFPISFAPNYPEHQNRTVKLELIQGYSESANEFILRVPGEEGKLLILNFINKSYFKDPWFITYLTNKGLLVTIVIMITLFYQLWRNKSGSNKDTAVSSMKNKLLENQNIQNKKLDEISQKLAYFEEANKKIEDFSPKIGNTGGLDGLKSNLKAKTSTGSKKNVRFADDY